jgi:hypothetical protein
MVEAADISETAVKIYQTNPTRLVTILTVMTRKRFPFVAVTCHRCKVTNAAEMSKCVMAIVQLHEHVT